MIRLFVLIFALYLPYTEARMLDFYSEAWPHIYRWECNKKNGQLVPTYLKDNNEFNFCGISLHAHYDFYYKILAMNFNAGLKFDKHIRIPSAMLIAKDLYKEHYFKKVVKLPKCLRLSVFDQQVLSGRGIKMLQRSLGLKEDGIIGPKTLAKAEPTLTNLKNLRATFIAYLKTTKYKGKSLWKSYGNGWTNRINNAYDKSKSHCIWLFGGQGTH